MPRLVVRLTCAHLSDSLRRKGLAPASSTLTYVVPMSDAQVSSGERWHAQDVRRLAALVMVSERTVYRWYEKPESTHRGTALRLEAAAKQIGARLPKASAA